MPGIEELATLLVKIQTDTSEMEGGLQKAQKSLNKFSNVMLGAGGAITGSLVAIVKGSIDAGSAMSDMSVRTGVAVEDLSRMSYVAEQIGASSQNLEMALKNLSIRMDDNAQKGEDANDAFTRLGISVLDTDGKMKSVTQIMLELADKFANIEDAATRTGLAADLFGARAGTQLMEMLALGSEGMTEYMNKADKLGITMSTTQAQAADKLGDSLADIQASMAGLARSIAEALIPAIQPLVDHLIAIIQKFNEWRDAHPGLFDAITKLVAVGGPLMLLIGALGKVVAIIGTAGAAGGTIIGAFSSMLPFLGPAGLIAAGVAAVVLVWKNWDSIKGWVNGAWEAVKNFATQGLENVKSFASNTWDTISNWATNTYSSIKSWSSNAVQSINEFSESSWDKMKSWSSKTWDNYVSWTEKVGKRFMDFAKQGGGFAEDFWSKYNEGSTSGGKKLQLLFGEIITSLGKTIASGARDAYKWGADLFNSLWDGMKGIWNTIYNWLSNVGNAISNFFSNLVNRIKTTVSNLWGQATKTEQATPVPSYQTGGIVSQTGLAYLHQGETVLPKGVQPVQIQFGDIIFSGESNPIDVRMKARELADTVVGELKRRGIQLA
ncbi:MAG TPA: phage tail tape measure protein [Thermodesulfovibrio thiophilus]|nr:phage tail tape measure protein [Thermodesulfovibrio thiophilus]